MDRQLLHQLTKALRGWRAKTRREAVAYLAFHAESIKYSTLDTTTLVKNLAGALSDRDAEVRQHAAQVLKTLGPRAALALQALREAANGKDDELGMEAARALREVGPAGYQALLHLYRTEKPHLQERAVAGLLLSKGQVDSFPPALVADAVSLLSAALVHENASLRSRAALAFRWYSTHAQSAVALLLQATADADRSVRHNAASTLVFLPVEIGGTLEPALRLLEHDPEPDTDLISTVAFLGRRARAGTSVLMKLLSHAEDNVRREVRRALARIGPEAVPPLAAALREGSVAVRCQAAEALGEFYRSCPAAAEALTGALQDESIEVRREAANHLVMFGREAAPALPGLLAALREPDEDLRTFASNTLCQLKKEPVAILPGLIELLQAPDADQRFRAAEVIGSIGTEAVAATPHLVKLVNDQDADVREAGLRVLAAIAPGDQQIAPHAVTALADSREDVQKAALKLLATLGSSSPSVHAALRQVSDSDKLRRAVRVARARCSDNIDDILQALKRELQSEDDRGEALETIGEMGAAASVLQPDLLTLFTKCVRRAAKLDASPPSEEIPGLAYAGEVGDVKNVAKAYWNVGGQADKVVPTLAELLLGGGLGVRESIADLFSEMGPQAAAAAPALTAALRAGDFDTAWAAGDALCLIGPAARTAIPALVDALQDPHSAGWAVRVLGAIGAEAVPALVRGLKAPDSTTREWAADALGRIGPPAAAAVDELSALLTDKPPVRYWAAIALASIRPQPEMLPILLEALASDSSDIRAGAAVAIGAMGQTASPAMEQLRDAMLDGDGDVRQAAHEAIKRVASG